MQLVKSKDVELDVYSSTQIYGDLLKNLMMIIIRVSYEQAEDLPNVNYIGYVKNQEIRNNLPIL